MKTISRYIMTLALLITAASGAWADETLLLTIESKDYTTFRSGSMTIDDKVTVTLSNSVFNEGNSFGWYSMDLSQLTVAGTNGYTITSCKFYTQSGTANTGYTVEGESPSVYLYNGYVYTDANQSVKIGSFGVTKIEVYGGVASSEPDVEVTTNEAKTEASFDMPAFDATAEYELVRDMSVQMTVKVGEEGEDGFTIRVKKDGESYVPSEMTMQEMIALITATDNLDAENPVTLTNKVDYTVEIFAADADGKPTGEAVAFNQLVPGTTYVAVATGIGAYDGTALSNTFLMTEAYDLTLSPATDANLKSVTVGEGTEAKTATPDENGVIKNIEPGKKVKITTTGPDYIIRKATVTKTVNMLYIEASNHKLYYMEGETWRQAIDNHADLNQGWQYGGMEVWFGNIVNVLKGNGAAVDPGSVIDPTKTYTL